MAAKKPPSPIDGGRRLSGKKSKKELLAKEKLHKKITRKHPEFELTYDMMLGIRTTVSKIESKLHGELKDSDYDTEVKMPFPSQGSANTPAHEMRSFKFKDYAPEVFRNIRARFGISPADYLLTICGDFQYLEFISNSKSGQFFFYSHDRKFMIKTISRDESKFLRKILPGYYKHVMANPNTLLTRFFGMHRVKPHKKKEVHFLIMGSVFYGNKFIHVTFDLKGSKQGRHATEEEKESGGCVFKDNDFLDQKVKISVGPEKAKLLKHQIVEDIKFLRLLKIMDYSLLLGIHYGDRPIPDSSKEQRLLESDTQSKMGRKKAVARAKILKKKRELGISPPTIEPTSSTSSIPTTVSTTISSTPSSTSSATHCSTSSATSSTTMSTISSSPEEKDPPPITTVTSEITTTTTTLTTSSAILSTPPPPSFESERPPVRRATSALPTSKSALVTSGSTGRSSLYRTRHTISGGHAFSISESSENDLRRQSNYGLPKRYNVFSSPIDIRFHAPNPDSLPLPETLSPSKFEDEDDKETSTDESGVQSVFTADDGGVQGTNPDGKPLEEWYFMGVIDILTEWNAKKKVENRFKTIKYDREAISAVDPEHYAKRFVDFLCAAIK